MKPQQTIILPRHLPGDLHLAIVNQQLRSGQVQLDWSQVQPDTAPDTAVRTLLDGLNVRDHIDIIGADTIPQALQPLVQTILSANEESTQESASQATATTDGPAPELWLPPQAPEMVEEEVEEENMPTQQLTAAPPLLQAPPAADMRDELETLVIRDLLGPAAGEEEEVTDAHVYERYLTGMLAPSDMPLAHEEMDSSECLEEGPDDTGATDRDNLQAASLSPSTMGMSLCVSLQIEEVQVRASWGHYQRASSQTTPQEKTARPRTVWKRTPRGSTHMLPLREGVIDAWRPAEDEQPEVEVRGIIRRRQDCWLVTLFLVNGQKKPQRSIDRAWLFQPELSVQTASGEPLYRGQSASMSGVLKPEDRAMAMLYRQHINFATGHGVSTHVTLAPSDPTSALCVTTTFTPRYDVPHTEAPTAQELPGLAHLCLDMRVLAETPASELPTLLQPLISAYSDWIQQQERRASDPASRLENFQREAQEAIQHCRRTLGRIQVGITMLANNAQAARAFAFMNRAMWQQRIHTLYASERRNGGTRSLADFDMPVNRSWRPFQLAFILLNLPPLTDPRHPNRSGDASAIADLLWFPTGGGKTEAYLGLTAYTLAIRRLQGDRFAGRSGLDGVAVIMRYTLRLLTLQQFQRAAALLCACEMIRRNEGSEQWGSTPFRLGLWVGMRATPNTTQESADAIAEERGASHYRRGGSGSPRQLTHCPWCGAPIHGGQHLTVDKERERTITYCGDPFGRCEFSQAKAPHEGLPVLVVDEEIYRFLPGLLIATVDKFAQMPWKGETQMLFGQVDRYCERHGFLSPDIKHAATHKASGKWTRPTTVRPHAPLRPPDLIIQDELHLISGPLGTLVGLYETAIDHLSSWEIDGSAARPKVIAATATIRQADLQVRALFMRKVNIFPPQGLDVQDNFFSRQRPPSTEIPGRRYLGICAGGKRLKAAEIRVYLAYLAAAQVLYEKYGPPADPWMTLVGYFNSVRELGGMRHMLDDDIKNRIWRMAQRGLASRTLRKVEELTSRVGTSNIPDVLSMLEMPFGADQSNGARPTNGVKGTKHKVNPIDVLLATNMISVGVDIKRLGLMVVTGQPKTTAEYIQATSRVGRSHPGMVCVIHHWARPRDLSHYEQFEQYHATFYQRVEALSVTPFAPRALDRGLAALLTSIVRLSGPQFNKNDAAGNLTPDNRYLTNAIATITTRAEEVDSEAAAYIGDDLQRLKDHWLREIEEKPRLGYETQRDGTTLGLLKEPQRGQWEPFTCLNSLRNVEPNVRLILDEHGSSQASSSLIEDVDTPEEGE